jgi:hypothetical protein
MKKNALLLTALSVLAAGGLAQAQTTGNIAAVEAAGSGTVTINSDPIITALMSVPGLGDGGTKTYTSYAILATDGTGSVELFGKLPTGSTYVPTVGDEISVSGTYSPYNQIPEVASMTAISLVSSGNVIPAPQTYTLAQVEQATLPLSIAGYLISIEDVTIAGASGNFPTASTGYTINDSSTPTGMELYDWTSSYSAAGALAGTPIPTGPVDITGLMDVFTSVTGGVTNSTPEFIPYSVTPVAAPEPTTWALAAMGGLSMLAGLRRRK